MLEEPASVQAEAFRMLRAKLDPFTLDQDVPAIMVTSALEHEGKSTTVANLAIAFARAGKRVVLVDLDLRRPRLARFFDLEGPGLTQVALLHVPLEDALTQIVIADPRPAGRRTAPPRAVTGTATGPASCRVCSRCCRRARSRLTQASSFPRPRSGRSCAHCASVPTSSLSTHHRRFTSATRSR